MAGSEAPVDLAAGEAGREELSSRNDPMLAGGERRDDRIGVLENRARYAARFTGTIAVKCAA